MSSVYDDNIRYARIPQEKFEYYLVALTFTLLGLSVQTVKFGSSNVADILELVGWVVLLLSGIMALLRLEMQPVVHNNYARLDSINSELSQLLEAQARGTTEVVNRDRDYEATSIEESIKLHSEFLERNEPKLKQLEDWIIKKTIFINIHLS